MVRVPDDPVALVVDDDDFARFDVPDEFGGDDVQSAGLGSQDVSPVLHAAQAQGAETIGVQGPIHGVGGHEQVGETSVNGVEGILEFVQESLFQGATDQVHEHFRIRIGMEDGPIVLQLGAQGIAIGQVPVVAEGYVPVMEVEEERLHVVEAAGA